MILIKFASWVPSISVEQFLNGAQFLNTTCVAASSDCFLRTGLPAIVIVTVIFPVTKIYASE